MGKVKCPDCFGTGRETCHNPDHGFLSGIISIVGANESACPCCGHDEDHQMSKYNKETKKREYNTCYTCKGSKIVTEDDYQDFVDEFVYEDEDLEYLKEFCFDLK